MKKQTKKLELSRETLRSMDQDALRDVAGANTLQYSCDTISWRTCTTSDRC
jgi:hypothetical protein